MDRMFTDSKNAIISMIGIKYITKSEGYSGLGNINSGSYHLQVQYKNQHTTLSYTTKEERDNIFDTLVRMLVTLDKPAERI